MVTASLKRCSIVLVLLVFVGCDSESKEQVQNEPKEPVQNGPKEKVQNKPKEPVEIKLSDAEKETIATLEGLGGKAKPSFWFDGLSVSFSMNTIMDEHMVLFKVLPQLSELYLESTHITDAGLVHLKGLTELSYLNLRGTEVTDSGLVHLKGVTKLIVLDLIDTQVTDSGAKALQAALPKCEIKR
jgi:hypothetical protein